MGNSECIAKNAIYICKLKGIKIQDLEQSVGLSQGYLSRCRVGKKHSMGIDYVVNIANYLNVKIDTLLDRDYLRNIRIKILQKELEYLEKGELIE